MTPPSTPSPDPPNDIPPITTHTVIIGAGAAGLAVGALLKRAVIPFEIVEQARNVGATWRGHYDRLKLHTDKGGSALPLMSFPEDVPRYPSRDQLVAYLEAYAARFGLAPRFEQRVEAARFRDGMWNVRTPDHRYRAPNLVVATGHARVPHRPTFPGEEGFPGRILHSAEYANGESFTGLEVLVVGFGNSAGEIAIDLHEHGARPSMSVRRPVNVVGREMLGIPVLTFTRFLRHLPPRLADALSAPVRRLVMGDLTRHGLRKPPYGPLTQINRDRRIPLIDTGTIGLIKQGRIRVLPGLARFDDGTAVLVDGARHPFDAVVLATGFRPAVGAFLDAGVDVLDAAGAPRSSGREAAPGLYFCGFHVSPGGMLASIRREARQISRAIAAKGAPRMSVLRSE